MNSLPLHPAIVHLPMGLAVIMPLVALGFGWALWTRRITVRGWAAVVALQALLVASSLVAINTGGTEEERVEAAVPEAAIEAHEEAAEQFAWAAGLTVLVAASVLVLGTGAAGRALLVASVVATTVVAGLGVRVGHAGGTLVYAHGAAAAYTASPSTPPRALDDDDRGGQ